jgi:hypothetical protein
MFGNISFSERFVSLSFISSETKCNSIRDAIGATARSREFDDQLRETNLKFVANPTARQIQ